MSRCRVFAAEKCCVRVLPLHRRPRRSTISGVTDKEIKLGHTNPYSDPFFGLRHDRQAIAAYWTMVNETGGINGRKINFLTYDDGFSRPRPSKWSQAGRGRQGLRDFPAARYADQHGRAEIPEPKEGPQLRDRCFEVGHPEGVPLDDGLATRLRHRGGILRQAHAGHAQGQSQGSAFGDLGHENDDSGKPTCRRLHRRPRQGKREERVGEGELRSDRSRPSTGRSSRSRAPRQRRLQRLRAGSWRRRSARPPTRWKSITTSPTSRRRWLRCWKPRVSRTARRSSPPPTSRTRPTRNGRTTRTSRNGTRGRRSTCPTPMADSGNVYAYAVSTMRHRLNACGDNLTRENLMKQAASMVPTAGSD